MHVTTVQVNVRLFVALRHRVFTRQYKGIEAHRTLRASSVYGRYVVFEFSSTLFYQKYSAYLIHQDFAKKNWTAISSVCLAKLFPERPAYVITMAPNEIWSLMPLISVIKYVDVHNDTLQKALMTRSREISWDFVINGTSNVVLFVTNVFNDTELLCDKTRRRTCLR